MPKVSVILPTHNRAAQVQQAIASVLSQTYADYEVIVVDDGSTDDTRQVVFSIASQHEKVQYLYQDNQGRSAARNAGIRAAGGAYIAFLDSDDMFLPDKLQQQVAALDHCPEYGMVYHPVRIMDAAGQALYGGEALPGRLSGWIYPDLLFIKWTVITTPSVMVRSRVLAEVGGFDETLHVCEDLDLWRRIARRYPILQLDEPLAVVCYRHDEPLALHEKKRARIIYYQKAMADDPVLQPHLYRRLLGEMFYQYGKLALLYRDWRTGLPWLATSAWLAPADFLSADLVAVWARLKRFVRGQLRAVSLQLARPFLKRILPPSLFDRVRALYHRWLLLPGVRSVMAQFKRRLFNRVMRPFVQRFVMPLAELVAAQLSRLPGNPAQSLFAQYGFSLARQAQPGQGGALSVTEAEFDDRRASSMAEELASYLSRQGGNPAHAIFYKHGFHLLRKHFYAPIPDEADIQHALASQDSELIGIHMNENLSLELLAQVFPLYSEEFSVRFPLYKEQAREPHQFYLINGSYMAVDANVYYSLIRHFKPRRIIEIGSGSSTLLAGAAAIQNRAETGRATELIAIDPYPWDIHKQGFPGLSRLIEARVQDVDLDLFTSLQSGDILFIDSSHVLRAGGDVHMEYLEILPRLAPGVYVHIHDISLPKPYPQIYFEHQIYWNEQYLLQAFLAFNQRFEVVWPGNYMLLRYPDRVMDVFPEFKIMRKHYPMSEPSAFWMRARPAP